MELGDAVRIRGELEGEDGHAEALALVVGPLAAQGEEGLPLDAQLLRPWPEIFLHQLEPEALVARRHRSVRGENIRWPDRLHGLGEGEGLLYHDLADALEGQESRMPLVHVRDHDVHAEGAEGSDAAHSQEDFLAHAGLGVAAVQSGGDRPVLGRVLLDIGIEEEERGPADRNLPDLRGHRPAGHLHVDEYRPALVVEAAMDRHVVPVVFGVGLLLEAVGV